MRARDRSPSSFSVRRAAAHKRWALLRLVLGLAQIFGATVGFVLIAAQGVTRVGLIVFALTTLCTDACTPSRDNERGRVARATEAAFNEARDATLLGSAVRVADNTGPRREGIHVSAEWSFEIPSDWPTYVREVTAALQAKGYQPTSAAPDLAAFSKREPGDIYSVTVRAVSDSSAGSRLKLVATFAASPD